MSILATAAQVSEPKRHVEYERRADEIRVLMYEMVAAGMGYNDIERAVSALSRFTATGESKVLRVEVATHDGIAEAWVWGDGPGSLVHGVVR